MRDAHAASVPDVRLLGDLETQAEGGRGLRLAYADPPYPGYAKLYPEKQEVDHAELVTRLERDYDGWALSTNENTLQYVLGLCPPKVRILAWCKTNAPPFLPNPVFSWEPVVCRPARADRVTARSFLIGYAPSGHLQRDGITGQKPRSFCEWVLRCLGAEAEDTLDDLFPGTGVMGEAFAALRAQPALPLGFGGAKRGAQAIENIRRRRADGLTLDGIETAQPLDERRVKLHVREEPA